VDPRKGDRNDLQSILTPDPMADEVQGPTWRSRLLAQKARLADAARKLLRADRESAAISRPLAGSTASHPAGVSEPQSRAGAAEGAALSRFTEGQFGHPHQRRYMLYRPAFRRPGPAPLLVLLHGCHQRAEEFAAATRMNEAAEDAGVVVLYPEQSALANPMRCWNWYAPQDAESRVGDGALIAAMTRQVMQEQDIDPARVYVAGMSAGGAMAAVLARDYPDLYAALGVHSGVPAGMANNLYSAMRLMRQGPAQGQVDAIQAPDEGAGRTVPSIVFHGDEDTMVHPSNGEAIHAAPAGDQDEQAAGGSLRASTDSSDGKRGFTRSVEYAPGGVTQRELWIVHGAGHAWAGGSEQQRYTDADGPTASREMLRFFLQHRLPCQVAA
jgi:poly(hydroxyalkanoate) depolymerase family esterase